MKHINSWYQVPCTWYQVPCTGKNSINNLIVHPEIDLGKQIAFKSHNCATDVAFAGK